MTNMKTILLIIVLSLAAASTQAQITTVANISTEKSFRYTTNTVDDCTNRVTYVIAEEAPVRVIRYLEGNYAPVSTNVISLTPSLIHKPLLSAQRPPPRPAPVVARNTNAPVARPATKIPGPPNTNSVPRRPIRPTK